jgi:hypothetical protein
MPDHSIAEYNVEPYAQHETDLVKDENLKSLIDI